MITETELNVLKVMAEKDIKFNRVNLRKLTTQKDFIFICQKYYNVLTT